MISFELNAVFSLTIGLSAIIGWIRFKKTGPAFLPVLLLVTTGFINEALGTVLAYSRQTIETFNAYLLLSALLVTWQFYRWELFSRGWQVVALVVFFIVSWLAETLMIIHEYASWFSMLHSLVLDLMAISVLNRVAVTDSGAMSRNAVFLICLGFMISFSFTVILEGLWVAKLNDNGWFRLKLQTIDAYLNLFVNLLFAYAFLWIPMKPRYIVQY